MNWLPKQIQEDPSIATKLQDYYVVLMPQFLFLEALCEEASSNQANGIRKNAPFA